jgi:hypothetical protein
LDKSEYLQHVGSLTLHLIVQNISNEEIMEIILDFKVTCEELNLLGTRSGAHIADVISRMYSESESYDILAPWIMSELLKEKPIYN